MEEFYQKCPVCESNMSENICENCGYIKLLFPSYVPKKIRDYESKRLEKAKFIWEKRNQASFKDKDKQIVGTVIIRNLVLESHYAFPIYEGVNCYGSNPQKVSQIVDSDRVGTLLPDVAFAIRKEGREMFFKPANGVDFSKDRNLVIEETPITEDDFFFLSNILCINAIPFK